MKNKPVIIILGAGASHDYIDEGIVPMTLSPWKPPLTDQIFGSSQHTEIIDHFPEATNLVSGARLNISKDNTLESYIQKVSEKSKTVEGRQRQLIAFRFYLQNLFEMISEKYYQHGNNHGELVNQILDREGGGTACVVTFNYDTLFEKSVDNVLSTKNLYSYIDGEIKVIKPHGSHNWAHVISTKFLDDQEEIDDLGAYKFLMRNPSFISGQDPSKVFVKLIEKMKENKYQYHDPKNPRLALHIYPAIAIPTTSKHEFVLPEDHLNTLVECLKETDRILVIGWKAGDNNLLGLMEDNINRAVHVTAVSPNDPESILNNMYTAKVPIGSFKHFKMTYTEFMKSNEAEKFFNMSK